jgi:SAM-dependent methyltransferase
MRRQCLRAPVAAFQHSAQCILLWGHNPSTSLLAAATRIAEARARGAKLIVVDLRHAGFAVKADCWLRVRPGTDAALALPGRPEGRVVGVDITDEMLDKARAAASRMGLSNVEFRKGIIEDMPIGDGWADVVISNGVINLCADKRAVFGEIFRVLRPGGRLQFADIANCQPVPEAAIRKIDLWTA